MSVARAFVTILFVVCVPVALITTNVRFMANEPRVYRYAFDEYGAVETTGIARDELLRVGAEIRDYFNNDQETLSTRVPVAGREVSLFNPQETQHMKDVKQRFNTMNRAQEFSLIYVIAYVAVVVLWADEVTSRRLATLVLLGCALGLAAMAGAAAVAMAGFDSAWESFHEVLFTNDFWRLNPATDHLIQMFPPAFWEDIVFFIGLLTAAEAAVIMIGAVIYLGATRHASERQRLEPYYA